MINDTLTVSGPSINDASCVWTKRKVLQVIPAVLDPLGYFAPTVLDAKLFMKILWINMCEWEVSSEFS